jgi:transcriptional regulator with XRE-family HTH domain
MTRFGRRMRQRREQLGMSQQELSRLTGIPQSRLSEFEGGGRTEMTVSTALKVARALGVGIDYLAGTFDEAVEAFPAAEAAPAGTPTPGARRRGRPRAAARTG